MNKANLFFLTFLLVLLYVRSGAAEEHTVQKGETALQIALDHGLTIDQLSRLNPGIDLEMMHVGDILSVPGEGVSFEDYLSYYYNDLLRITDLNCEVFADQTTHCLFHAENMTEVPLYNVAFRAILEGENRSLVEFAPPMMQIQPGEKLPCCVGIPQSVQQQSIGITVEALDLLNSAQSSLRLPAEVYTQKDSISPDAISAVTDIMIDEKYLETIAGKHINILSAAYDESNNLAGVKSLYADLSDHLRISVYTASHRIARIDLRLEVY